MSESHEILSFNKIIQVLITVNYIINKFKPNIKKKLLLFSLLAVLIFLGYAGRMPDVIPYVTTPRTRLEVYCQDHDEFEFQTTIDTMRYNDSIEIINLGYNAKIIGDPSNTYNCHFYAWHMSEGGNGRLFMPGDQIYKYVKNINGCLGDSSYMDSDTLHADKVVRGGYVGYPSGEGLHSMTWSPDPDGEGRDWISKNGNRSLVQHSKYQNPGNIGNEGEFHHYAKAYIIDWKEDPYIEGLGDFFCEDSSKFKIVVNPHFELYSVSSDGKLDVTLTTNKDSIIIKRNGTDYGNSTITIIIRNGCDVKHPYYKTVSLGSALSNVWAYWQDPVCMCAWNQYDIRTTYHPSDMSFDWQFMYGDVQDICPPYHIRVTSYIDGGYVTLVATNGCGVDTTINVNYPECGYCPDYYMVYPNPSNSSDIIYIETTKEALEKVAKAKDIMENLSAVEAANIKLPNLEDYDYQILSKIGEVKINGKAIGGKVILNVSQLKPGVYYVIIDSGIKPETHELIIN